VDTEFGWVVGGAGLILYTPNGGDNWFPMMSGTSEHLNSVFFQNQFLGWVIGENGKILRTTDGGMNWEEQFSGTIEDLNGISFVDEYNGWVVGTSGKILHTTNGGINWVSLNSGELNTLNSSSFTDPSNGWVVGEGGAILNTTDGGASWISWDTLTTTDLKRVIFLDASYGPGWVVGEQGKIFRYENAEPVEFIEIKHWPKSDSVTLFWKSIEGAVYDVYAGGSILASFADIGDANAVDTIASWTDTDVVSERYYSVHSRSNLVRTSNTVGQFRLTVHAEDPLSQPPDIPDKMQLVSLPFVQYFTPVDSVIGAQLTGDESEVYADRIWRWDPDSSEFRLLWLVDSVGPCCDGRWFETVGGTPVPTDLNLDADMGFWIQNRHEEQEIILVGEVSSDSNRIIDLLFGIQEFGSSYPVVVNLDYSDLYQDGAVGSINELNADRIWYWDTDSDSWDFAWLVDGVGPPYDGRWWDSFPNGPTAVQLSPGKGYRFELRNLRGHTPFTWTYPKPYDDPPNE
jgi:hypothetical protein